MALKSERVILETDITRNCASVSERGVIVVQKVGGSGVVLGTSAGSVELVANPSGKRVVGLLLNDVVSIDETRNHRNFHKDETKVDERCTLLRKGRVTTNKVTGTPVYGDIAYLRSSGTVDPAPGVGGLVDTPKVGMFIGSKDENGYATVDVNLPLV